jgi:hypothetical protein
MVEAGAGSWQLSDAASGRRLRTSFDHVCERKWRPARCAALLVC